MWIEKAECGQLNPVHVTKNKKNTKKEETKTDKRQWPVRMNDIAIFQTPGIRQRTSRVLIHTRDVVSVYFTRLNATVVRRRVASATCRPNVIKLCCTLTIHKCKKRSLSHQLTAQLHIENSKNKKMVITLLQHIA